MPVGKKNFINSEKLQHVLLATLVAGFCLPLVIQTALVLNPPNLRSCVSDLIAGMPWLCNASLKGMDIVPSQVLPTTGSFMDRSYQTDMERAFNEGFPAREAFIRGINEGYLWVFGKPALNFNNSTVTTSAFAVGEERALFDLAYLQEYFIRRTERRKIEEWVNELAKFQELCRSRGTAFVFVITPTKVTACPEWVPEKWRRRMNPKPRPYEMLKELLMSKGIEFVDGVSITNQLVASGKLKTSAFPLGGIHWTKETALYTVNAVLEKMRQQHLNVRPVEVGNIQISNKPEGTEADLLGVMNFALPWQYPFPIVSVKTTKGSPRYAISGIGGSFGYEIAELLTRSGQFSEFDYFFYLTTAKKTWVDGVPLIVRAPVGKIDVEREILAADAVLLEVNDIQIREANHIKKFLKIALKDNKQKESKKAPYAYEGYVVCHPGICELIPGKYAGSNSRAALIGFLQQSEPGALSFTNPCSLRLRWEGPAGMPLRLKIVSGLPLDPNMNETAQVKVQANGTPIATWSYSLPENLREREAIIPVQCLNASGEITLEFTIIPSSSDGAAHLRLTLGSVELSPVTS